MDKVASYEELIKIKLITLRTFIPILSLDDNCIFAIIDILKKVAFFYSNQSYIFLILIVNIMDLKNSKSTNWRTRLSTLQIIQNFGIYNMFLLSIGNKKEIKKITIDLIYDEDIRVRNAACVSLTSLIHSNFVEVELKLIVRINTISHKISVYQFIY